MAAYKVCHVSNVYIFFVFLRFVLRVHSTFLDIEELQKSKYGVEISAEPVLLLNNQDEDGSILQITSKHGQQYQCVLPIVHFETKESNIANITTEEITKLLQPLNNSCIYQVNGWWSYRVCVGRSVDQYHEEGHVILDNISLGNFSGNTDWSNVTIKEETKGARRYHSQFYNNGTVCDLTGEPRTTEVRFYCDLHTTDVISRIDESSTCNYVIDIHTSRLCNHSLFRPRSTLQKQSITCSPALKEDQYKKYTETQHMKSADVQASQATVDDEENVKEAKLDADLKVSEEKKMKNMMNNIITKQMKMLKKLKLPMDEYEEDVNSDDESDDYNDDVTVDEEETYDGEDVDKEDDLGWDMDNIDDDNMDIEGSSTSSKRTSIFSNMKKDKKSDKSDHYHELIEFLKKQYRHFKKQLESVKTTMKKRVQRLEKTIGSTDPNVKELFNTVKKSVEVLEYKQRIADDAMTRLSELYDTVMEDQDYSKANKELAGIRSTLVRLIDKMNLKHTDETDDHDMAESEETKNQPYKPSEEILKPGKKTQGFEMEKPNLDKVVSKLKKIMTHENVDGDTDEFDDDHISVRVTKIKEKSEDIYDDKELERSFMEDNDENQFDEINENEEMRKATKKMESMVRKQLEDAGMKHEGKIKVKIITSKEALERVAGGEEKFKILTSQETNQFRDLLSNLLGGTQQLMEEKKRQEVMEDNYNLVWNQNSFTSATVSEKTPSLEHEDSDEG